MNSVTSHNLRLKYQRFRPQRYKDIKGSFREKWKGIKEADIEFYSILIATNFSSSVWVVLNPFLKIVQNANVIFRIISNSNSNTLIRCRFLEKNWPGALIKLVRHFNKIGKSIKLSQSVPSDMWVKKYRFKVNAFTNYKFWPIMSTPSFSKLSW